MIPAGHHIQAALQRHLFAALQVGWGPSIIVVEYGDERGRFGPLQPGQRGVPSAGGAGGSGSSPGRPSLCHQP